MAQGLLTSLLMGTDLYDKGTCLVTLNPPGWYFDRDHSIPGWAGGVVTTLLCREEDARNSSLWEDEKVSTEGCGDSSASAASRYRGSTGAWALNNEEVSYGGGAVRVVSTLIKEGSYSDLLLIFEDCSFDRGRSLTVVLGLDDENEGACSPLDYPH